MPGSGAVRRKTLCRKRLCVWHTSVPYRATSWAGFTAWSATALSARPVRPPGGTRHESAAARREESWFVPSRSARIDAEDASAALQTLPLDERETIVARLWGGLSFEEIADLTGTTRSTAHRRYAAGLAALRDKLNIARVE